MKRIAILALCACAGSPAPGGARRGDDDGTAAQIICAAECRRAQRCAENDPDCPDRCARLPVRHPAVWSAAWAGDIARCFDAASCAHDAEEGCVLATSRRTAAADACYASASRTRMCPVLNGLTDAAAGTARACFAAGSDDCIPPLDWK